jgi:hypothetical protein
MELNKPNLGRKPMRDRSQDKRNIKQQENKFFGRLKHINKQLQYIRTPLQNVNKLLLNKDR